MSSDAREEWQDWRERRRAAISGPYGPLALAGTHWLADRPDGRIEGLPGHWTAQDDAVVLRAGPDDGLTVDGRPAAGEFRLGPDADPASTRVAFGERHLLVLCRDGGWAVRDFDPASQARRSFAGIDVYEQDERWVRPGLFRPYAQGRTIQVRNADGQRRGLGLAGELAFTLEGDERTLQVAVEGDGSLWAVLADATSGTDSYRFRFLRPPAPAADGTVTVDLNRILLPPCAFADHFLCPFPPPGNTLSVALRAGERNPTVR
ncbi:DUF1684 domain-containing protein [Streptomyces sp. N2A]|uniref:DUF1684 domain-containing protein n=1 Tax=Streptomyces sp. N2A TaxID=3073936 RepID=UPI0028700050|nr:DUF1684 domain-containing protein [Streptomyces sp. N2A]